jgi:uncharacterized protein YrzB (UPF0473 family)
MDDSNRLASREEEEPIYEVTDENGQRKELIPIYTFDYNNQAYVVLVDRNEPDEAGFILRMEHDGDEVVLANIDNEEEWEAVSAIYEELVDQSSMNV